MALPAPPGFSHCTGGRFVNGGRCAQAEYADLFMIDGDSSMEREAPAAHANNEAETGSPARPERRIRREGNMKDKSVLITAAGQGIGRAIAVAFAAAGARVVATDIDAGLLTRLEREHGISTRRLDIRDDDAVREASREAGRVDVLVNCAGIVHSGSVVDMAWEELDLAFDINVKGMTRTIRAFLPAMLDHGEGCIINVASVVSSLKGAPNRFVYGTTKAAVIGLTKAVAADFVTRGIRCNAICPGTVDSPSLQARMREHGDYEAARNAFVARQPMGRLGTPEEIAELALHLARASYTTGQAYAIDGGWSI